MYCRFLNSLMFLYIINNVVVIIMIDHSELLLYSFKLIFSAHTLLKNFRLEKSPYPSGMGIKLPLVGKRGGGIDLLPVRYFHAIKASV